MLDIFKQSLVDIKTNMFSWVDNVGRSTAIGRFVFGGKTPAIITVLKTKENFSTLQKLEIKQQSEISVDRTIIPQENTEGDSDTISGIINSNKIIMQSEYEEIENLGKQNLLGLIDGLKSLADTGKIAIEVKKAGEQHVYSLNLITQEQTISTLKRFSQWKDNHSQKDIIKQVFKEANPLLNKVWESSTSAVEKTKEIHSVECFQHIISSTWINTRKSMVNPEIKEIINNYSTNNPDFKLDNNYFVDLNNLKHLPHELINKIRETHPFDAARLDIVKYWLNDNNQIIAANLIHLENAFLDYKNDFYSKNLLTGIQQLEINCGEFLGLFQQTAIVEQNT